MSIIKPKKKNSLKFYIPFWIFLVLFFSISFIIQNSKIKYYKQVEADLQQQVLIEQKNIEDLQKELEMNGTDEFYEKIAREELGMIMPDEMVYYIK